MALLDLARRVSGYNSPLGNVLDYDGACPYYGALADRDPWPYERARGDPGASADGDLLGD